MPDAATDDETRPVFTCGNPPAAANLHSCVPCSQRRLAILLQPRFHIVLACFLATLTAYVERVGFSIAFTAMAAEVSTCQLWQHGSYATAWQPNLGRVSVT
jgi:hypothetical protein